MTARPHRVANAAALALALGASAWGSTPAHGQGIVLALELVTSGFDRPLAVAAPNDGSGRLFVAEQKSGLIRVVSGGEILPTPFLDVGPLLEASGNEQGLLGLAFDPEYEANGSFYISYTEPEPQPPDDCPPPPADCSANSVVARYRVSATDPDLADPASATVLLRVNQERTNHNGGHLVFGADGFLYVGLGDGGGGGDPYDNAQDTTTLAGSLLRIDPKSPPPTEPNELCGEDALYGIPADNPFAGDDGACDEIWSYGLRNPWRFSFDRGTGDLWIGDVGQGDIEEIDFQAAASTGGENYGWNICEGSLLYPPPASDPPPCTGPFVDPMFEYPHTPTPENPGDFGRSVTGGFVSRGGRSPKLRGIYFYADFISGKIWGSVPRCEGTPASRLLLDSGRLISTFGEDESGELYIADFGTNSIFVVTSASDSDGPEAALSPAEIDYGVLEPGEQDVRELLLTNANPVTFDEALLVTAMTVSDPTRFQLDVAGGSDPCGTTTPCLAPGESCTVEIAFAPADEGFFNATVTVTGNTPPAGSALAGIARVPCAANPDPVVPTPDPPVADSRVETRCVTLIAGPYEIAATGVVVFRAGSAVELRNGFVSRGTFTAEIDPLLAVP